ncbi:MAG: hypothetical protein E6Y63_02755 [Haemophilus parainfluenzae]|nr:hypothetical protein [Haemophilus parainfluenzae]
MAYNLDKKLKEFEFERKQVLHHLALLDANIATLKRAIELTQQESDVALYNTDNFVYRSKYKLFKGKIRKYIVQIKGNGLIEFKSAEMRFTGNGNKNSGISTATYPFLLKRF